MYIANDANTIIITAAKKNRYKGVGISSMRKSIYVPPYNHTQ